MEPFKFSNKEKILLFWVWNNIDFAKGSYDLARLMVVWDEEFFIYVILKSYSLLPILIKICFWSSLFQNVFWEKEKKQCPLTHSISWRFQITGRGILHQEKTQFKSLRGESFSVFFHFIVAFIIISILVVSCGLHI